MQTPVDDQIQYLYKYRSLSDTSSSFAERIFTHNELYFPKPSEFNDPFDCSPVATLDATENQFATYLDGLYKRRMPHLSRADRRASVKSVLKDRTRNNNSILAYQTLKESMAKVVELAGVLSLSARCNHILMWSHYADSHRGICLRFKASSTTPFFGRAQRVVYQAERPKLNLILDNHETQSTKALLAKADFWGYEEEWRIVEHELGPGVHQFPPELLDGVILGARISDENKQNVMSWVATRKNNLEILQARFNDKSFRLDIVPV